MTDTLFVDIENDGPRLLLAGWTLNDDAEVRATLGVYAHDERSSVRQAVADPDVVKVTQGDHDLRHFLLHDGWDVAGTWHNVMVMAWVLDENQSLKQEDLTARYTPGEEKHKAISLVAGRLAFKKRWFLDEYDEWPDAVKWQFAEYCKRDVGTMRGLYRVLEGRLDTEGWAAYWAAEEVPYSSTLLRMECRGMPVDLDAARELADEVRGLRDGAEAELREMAGLPACFNLNSHDQVREYLFSNMFVLPDRLPMDTDPLPSDQDFEVTKVGRDYIHGHWLCRGLGLTPTDPPKRKDRDDTGGLPSTASPELLYKHGTVPFIQKLCLEYRRYDKLLSTYLEKFPKVAVPCPVVGKTYTVGPGVDTMDYRVFGRFNQTGTVTGRLSSSEPNLQNIPARRDLGRRVRGLFRGRFVIGDYDGLEMRLMAHFSQDPRLMQVFTDGADPHELTAVAVFGACDGHDDPRRDVGKTINYAIGYGAGAKKLAQTLSLAGFPTTFAEAKEYQERVAHFYPRLYVWKNKVIWRAKETGYVETIGGRRRRITRPDEGGKASFQAMGYGERQAVNSIIQGSAADILRRVMLRVDANYPELALLAQVHDELIWEYEKLPEPAVLESLQVDCERGHGFDLRVPLVFEPMVCDSWQEKGTGRDLELEELS